MFKLIAVGAFGLFLLPGLAWAEEPCHYEKAAAAERAHTGHEHLTHGTGNIEEVPHAVHASLPNEGGGQETASGHPGFHTCSTQVVHMKCGMHGCCIKTEAPFADSGFSPKVTPEMAVDANHELDLFCLQGPVSPYLLEKLSGHYAPIPQPPSA